MSGIPTIITGPAAAPAARAQETASNADGATRNQPVAAVARITHSREDSRARQTHQNSPRGERSQTGEESPQSLSTSLQPASRAAPTPLAQQTAVAQFLAQMLNQDIGPIDTALAEHRDGPALGSTAYRRAGAEPPVYSEQPMLFRVSA